MLSNATISTLFVSQKYGSDAIPALKEKRPAIIKDR